MASKHGSHWLEREDIGRVTVARVTMPKMLDDDSTRMVFDPPRRHAGEVALRPGPPLSTRIAHATDRRTVKVTSA
jgi:hypothetical protein